MNNEKIFNNAKVEKISVYGILINHKNFSTNIFLYYKDLKNTGIKINLLLNQEEFLLFLFGEIFGKWIVSKNRTLYLS